jgi:hypothetical protein
MAKKLYAKRLALILASLLTELAAYILVSVYQAYWWSTPVYEDSNFILLLKLWLLSIIYRVCFAHIYAAWRLKLYLIRKNVTTLLVSLSDLALAISWAGILTLFFPPARMLFSDIAFWAPIFSAIWLGSLSFILIFRKSMQKINETRLD